MVRRSPRQRGRDGHDGLGPARGALLLLAALCLAFAGCGGDEAAAGVAQPPSLGGATPAGDASALREGSGENADAPAVPADAPLVVFLGDSITAGLHLPRSEAFPAVLGRLLADEGLPVRVVNAGVSGDTSAGGLSRLDWLLRQQPDVLVVELGGNDGLRGVALSSIEDNLRQILERARQAGVRTLLLGIFLPANYGLEYTAGFRRIYERLAEESGTAWVPSFMKGVAGDPALNLGDMLHPNAEGHRRLAGTVLPALQELVEEVAAARAGR